MKKTVVVAKPGKHQHGNGGVKISKTGGGYGKGY